MRVSGERGLSIAKYSLSGPRKESISCLEAIAHTSSSIKLYKFITFLYLTKK